MFPAPDAHEISSDAIRSAVGELQDRLGDKVSIADAIRHQHGADEGWHAPVSPDAVVFGDATADVVTVAQVCSHHGVPLIAFGVGTSLEGHVAALRGGISLDVSGMNRVLEVNVDDLDCRVEAGLTRSAPSPNIRPEC